MCLMSRCKGTANGVGPPTRTVGGGDCSILRAIGVEKEGMVWKIGVWKVGIDIEASGVRDPE
jgi:hypothetical protein